MDLQQEWQNMNAEIAVQNKELYTSSIQLDAESHSLLQELLFKLKWKLRWIRIIDIPILIAALFTTGDLQLTLITIFFTYEVGGAFGRNDFNKIKTGVDYSSTTKEVLEENFKAITKILKGEKVWSYIFLPLSGPMGLIVYKLTGDNSFKNLLQSSDFLMLLGGLVLIGIPFIFLGQKMNNRLFAAHLKSLKSKINELSAQN